MSLGRKSRLAAAENFFLKYISVTVKFYNIKIIMFKTPLILGLLILCACYGRVDASPCPLPNHPGNVHSGQIIAALSSGSVPLLESVDTQCYNYSLPYEFQSAPEVAIAVHDFESEPTKSLFFYVKAVHSQSIATVPFVIRTYWSYTRWTQISFSFIAEDRHDLQSGYYQIDSGSLSGCQNGKQVEILMPFRNVFNNRLINHYLFLHGFQITTAAFSQARSPFEIQIITSTANVTGIAVALSVTSTTQIDSVYISYVAYQSTTLDMIVGSYVFDRTSSSSIAHTPSVSIPRSYARIYGITGFVINYNTYRLSLATRWDGFSFTFSLDQFTSITQYLSFNYIFFINSECKDCPGYSIAFNNTCISNCPAGTFRAPDNTCRDCGKGKVWNGTECVVECPAGQYLNTLKNTCECPPSLNWNGEACIPCTAGKVFVKEQLSCECPKPFKWNGFACAQVDECKNGKVWSVYSFSCECPETSFWNGTYCSGITPCKGGQVHNMNYQCVCPDNYYWSGEKCIYSPCVGGQVWQGTQCVCPANKNFNGKMCVECINGQVWNPTKKECLCEDGYKWNSQYCERTYYCTGNRVWNATYEQCICRENYFWSGYACLPIPTCKGGQYWNSVIMKCVCSSAAQFNGTNCVFCRNGQIWDTATLKCVCPPGTFVVAGRCQIQQQCTGGKTFMQNTLRCECPQPTTWNGDYCISNACQDGRTYDPKYMTCVCPDNKVFVGNRCVPPQVSCNNGRIWNQAIYACECPQGTVPNYQKCDPIKICTNGTTYNPLTNDCTCPYGQAMINFKCQDPNCPAGQYYNGYQCEVISCPPPSYFYDNRCVYGGPNQCSYGYQWNGKTCVLYPPTCPLGTQWKSSSCQSVGACQNGFYLSTSGSCESLPQKCTPPTSWSGDKCAASGSQCPNGTFLNNNQCQPYTPCRNGHIWDYNYLKCICPAGYISNGVSCVQCANGKSWDPEEGCICPQGSFDTGSSCESLTQNRCSNVPNTIWSDNKCLCRPGFTKIGFQCTCYGTQIGDLCDKCAYKPNSEYVSSSKLCRCLDGFTEVRGNCIKNTLAQGNDNPSSCNVGTYFNSNQKMCLPCPDGCLSCFDCYSCRSCRPEFIYNPSTELCVEKCGDGNKFVLECDDGNNNDGDGCSRDCKIEVGYTCTGGSPDNADSCYIFKPDRVSLTQTGQIRKSTSIVLNVKLNYMPSSLMFSGDCANNCKEVLKTSIIDGDRSAISINSQFIIGTKYSFAITIDFGRPYIGTFKASISVSQELVPKYFGAIPTDTLVVEVKPNYLAAVNDETALS